MSKPLSNLKGEFLDSLQKVRLHIRALNRQRLHRRRMKRGQDYKTWIDTVEDPATDAKQTWEDRLHSRHDHPTICLILQLEKGYQPLLLARTVSSVLGQIYPHWHLVLTNAQLLDATAKQGMLGSPQIELLEGPLNSWPSMDAQWVGQLELGDMLRPHSLAAMMLAAQDESSAEIIYSDEDKIDEDGLRFDHHFKPDWNHDFLLSANYIGRARLVKRTLWAHLQLDPHASTYEVNLACIQNLTDKQLIHVPHVLWHCVRSTSPTLGPQPVEKLQNYLNHQYPGAKASLTQEGFLRVHHSIPHDAPLVSIVICTRNQYSLLSTCISSILEKTTYNNYEIIVVDNGSDDPRTLHYLQQIVKENTNISVLRDDRAFNYSALNNLAVRHSKGQLIALLNNDIEVIGGDWLTEMVGHALRPEIGCVGAKLLYPDQTVQHAGVLIGSGTDEPTSIAAHYLRGIPRHAPGYANRALVTHQLTAVTAACLVIRKSTFIEVGGLDEEHLAVAFNDVDFCLRVGELGLKHVWTPHALLYHHESVSRGRDVSAKSRCRFLPELDYMRTRWAKQLKHDPNYNPNLCYVKPDFLLKRACVATNTP